MRRDYRLYELNDDEFERLAAQICVKWLGPGVIPFAPGKDGGRDAKFCGTAQCFPSAADPITGHCVIQAKHVAAADKSCSDREFARILKSEHPKVARLIKEDICQHYIVFTNRKLTGGADETHIAALKKLGLETAYIVAVERIHQALDEYQDIQQSLPNLLDTTPFRFEPADLIEVIGALHDYVGAKDDGFNSARDFDSIRIRDEKNRINGLSSDYYEQIIVNNSMPYFETVEQFLKNPRNRDLRALYHDTADELKQKILTKRERFASFDDVFGFIYEQVQQQRLALKGRRRLVSIMLHYMYFNCDIGSKEALVLADAHADA